MTEKKGNAVKIRDGVRVRNVAGMCSFQGGSGSLHKVSKHVGQDNAGNDFIDKRSFSEMKEPKQIQDQGLWRSTRQRRMSHT